VRLLLAPAYWIGRVFLWIFLLPIGIWRSLVHHRKKGERRTLEAMRKELDRREKVRLVRLHPLGPPRTGPAGSGRRVSRPDDAGPGPEMPTR
jgi:hypothetical protein